MPVRVQSPQKKQPRDSKQAFQLSKMLLCFLKVAVASSAVHPTYQTKNSFGSIFPSFFSVSASPTLASIQRTSQSDFSSAASMNPLLSLSNCLKTLRVSFTSSSDHSFKAFPFNPANMLPCCLKAAAASSLEQPTYQAKNSFGSIFPSFVNVSASLMLASMQSAAHPC